MNYDTLNVPIGMIGFDELAGQLKALAMANPATLPAWDLLAAAQGLEFERFWHNHCRPEPTMVILPATRLISD